MEQIKQAIQNNILKWATIEKINEIKIYLSEKFEKLVTDKKLDSISTIYFIPNVGGCIVMYFPKNKSLSIEYIHIAGQLILDSSDFTTCDQFNVKLTFN